MLSLVYVCSSIRWCEWKSTKNGAMRQSRITSRYVGMLARNVLSLTVSRDAVTQGIRSDKNSGRKRENDGVLKPLYVGV
jgi:hypothetical protein